MLSLVMPLVNFVISIRNNISDLNISDTLWEYLNKNIFILLITYIS